MNIGEAIKTLRKTKGYKQKELAEKSGLSINSLCQLEKGNTFPQKQTLDKLCEVLETSPAYLLFCAIEEGDVAPDKRGVFRNVHPIIKDFLAENYKTEQA